MTSASRRTSRERALASARLPIGVATTKSVPGIARQPWAGGSVKPAMNRAGARAEERCAELLRSRGLVLVERNWRCRLGEIDLIAEDAGVIVFVEVRMRR